MTIRSVLGKLEESRKSWYSVGPQKGRFLKELVEKYQPRRVLEIGTSEGYSCLWMVQGLPELGKIITLEADEDAAQEAVENVSQAGAEGKIEVVIGEDAMEVSEKVSGIHG